MGRRENKILLELDGIPIIALTARALCAAIRLHKLVIVTRPEERDVIATALRDHVTIAHPTTLLFADGGPERADSVRNGVEALGDGIDVTLVHDAARPFILPDLVRLVVERALEVGAAVPVLPVTDTLKRIDHDRIVETVPRNDLVRAQTPQGFRTEVLRRALASARTPSTPSTHRTPTDDVGWIEIVGGAIAAVPGDARNLKITTPADLELARFLLTSTHPGDRT